MHMQPRLVVRWRQHHRAQGWPITPHLTEQLQTRQRNLLSEQSAGQVLNEQVMLGATEEQLVDGASDGLDAPLDNGCRMVIMGLAPSSVR
jgi:hypothetical protein